ncbi:unnamed protein product [Closterium sp. Naga37s-1]|nr:unnamed protein product [Closterium sp. Naga37s-1]
MLQSSLSHSPPFSPLVPLSPLPLPSPFPTSSVPPASYSKGGPQAQQGWRSACWRTFEPSHSSEVTLEFTFENSQNLLLQGRPAAAARLAERLLAQLLGKGRRENGEGLASGGEDGEGKGERGGEEKGMQEGREDRKWRKRREKGEKRESNGDFSESGAAAAAAAAAAVEAVGVVWVQANSRMGRHSQVLSEFRRLFGALHHVPPPLFLIWLSLAILIFLISSSR